MPAISTVLNAPLPSPAPRSDRIENLENFVRVTDNIDGAISGPARMVVGVMDIVHAHDRHDVAKGADQILIGLSSAVYGTIGTLVTLGAVATAIGLSSVGLVMASTALVMGGTTAAGYAGGAAALLKGGAQLKNDPHKLIALSKLGVGAAMVAGAVLAHPVLITLGGVAYLVVSGIESRHEIANGVRHLGARLATMGHEVVSAFRDPSGTEAALDAAKESEQPLKP